MTAVTRVFLLSSLIISLTSALVIDGCDTRTDSTFQIQSVDGPNPGTFIRPCGNRNGGSTWVCTGDAYNWNIDDDPSGFYLITSSRNTYLSAHRYTPNDIRNP